MSYVKTSTLTIAAFFVFIDIPFLAYRIGIISQPPVVVDTTYTGLNVYAILLGLIVGFVAHRWAQRQ